MRRALQILTIGVVGGLAGALASASPPTGAVEGDGWLEIELDGTSQRASVVPVDGVPGASTPGDVLRVGPYLVLRGPERRPRFRSEAGRLSLLREDGAATVVAATVVAAATAGAPSPKRGAPIDGARALSDGELARLRGLRVEGVSGDLAAILERAGEGRIPVVVAGPDEDAPLPPLPAGTYALEFDLGPFVGGCGPRDLAPIARLTSLRSLQLGRSFRHTTDLAPLAACKALRHVDLGGRRVRQVEALGALPSLTSIDARGCEDLADVSFVRSLLALRALDVASTPVADLRPLASLPALGALDATGSMASALPTGPWPALRTLRVLCTRISAADVAAFRAEHPACRVAHSSRELLVETIAGVERIRVRTGGTGPRDPNGETTVAELTRPDEIDAFVAAVQIDDPYDPVMCACPGSPTFEFWKGDRLLAELGFHHGVRLRWNAGAWPGDAPLTVEAQDRICAWLSARGCTGPAEELAEQRSRQSAHERGRARMTALLGAPTLAALDEAGRTDADPEAATRAVLTAKAPDPDARALLCLRLLGLAGPEWSLVQVSVREELATLDDAVVYGAATEAMRDDDGVRGVVLWIFLDNGATPDGRPGVAAWAERAAARGLADSDASVRSTTIRGLARFRTPAALALVRRLLEGRVLAPSADARPAPAETRENLEAAVLTLLGYDDLESVPRIRALAAPWPADRRTYLEGEIAAAEQRARERAEAGTAPPGSPPAPGTK